mmetsp:Transcript_17291/g.47598  ORF Transcript_17291/g.47598 Transcript_17291/m.47598 type:complete len:207 (+) Transcript_17291:1761-2381(+)
MGHATSVGPSITQTSLKTPEMDPPVPPKTIALWPATAMPNPARWAGRVPVTESSRQTREAGSKTNMSFITPELFVPPNKISRCASSVLIPKLYRATGQSPPPFTWLHLPLAMSNKNNPSRAAELSFPPKMNSLFPKDVIPCENLADGDAPANVEMLDQVDVEILKHHKSPSAFVPKPPNKYKVPPACAILDSALGPGHTLANDRGI